MTSKERVLAALEGKPVDRMPVAVPYVDLYHMDHFAELTGREFWELHQWLAEEPSVYLRTLRDIVGKAPFDILSPLGAYNRHVEFVRRDGGVYLHHRKDDTYRRVDTKKPGEHPMDYHANETQTVFGPDDVRRIEVVKAETMLEREDRDGSHLRAAIREFGATHCIAHQSTLGVFWGCQMYLGQTNTLRMLVEDPDLIRCLSDRLLEMSIESVRFLSEVGLDLFYIDDAMGTSDMISPALYEQFSLPYLQAITAEIHRLGRKAVVIYFGGVSDRLELIASSGADGLLVETSMKNYTNDIVQIAERIGDRISLFGNIDPIGVLEQGTDEELEAEIQRQALAARKSRGFIMSTGSPITPLTPLARVQQYIRLAQQSSA